MNVISSLMEIATNPVRPLGDDVSDYLRRELSRRSVRLVRDGDQRKARMACSALVDQLESLFASSL